MQRDSSGAFIRTKIVTILGCIEVDMCEAWRFVEAISWAKNLGLENVTSEGDVKIVVDDIDRGVTYNLIFGDNIRACTQ